MTKITREEVLKLAKLSRIEILENEVDLVTKQLQDVLSYALRVKEIAKDIDIDLTKNINVFADDILQKTNPLPILEQAPSKEDNYFVVPKILDNL